MKSVSNGTPTRLQQNMLEARMRLFELRQKLGEEPHGDYELSNAIMALLGKTVTEISNPEAELRWLILACWLYELRCRRVAMGRDPQDERNAEKQGQNSTPLPLYHM